MWRLAEPGELQDPAYWVRHVRETVRFADAVAAMDAGAFLELGPDTVLAALAADTAPAAGVLRAGRPEPETFLTALARVCAHVDW